MEAKRTIVPRGTVYLPGSVHGFKPRTELALPESVAAALETAGHTVTAAELEAELKAVEPKA